MEIKVKAPKADNREVTVDVDIPQDLTGLVEKYGEPLIVSSVIRSLRIQVQAFVRPLIEANQSDEAIAEAAAGWVPGAERDSFASMCSKARSLSPEKRAELLALLGEA